MPGGVLTGSPALLESIGSDDLAEAAVPAPDDPAWTIAPLTSSTLEGLLADPRPDAFEREAAAGPMHDLAMFEHVHVIPRRRDLGAVLSDQEIEVEVWNAFRRHAKRLTEISIEGPVGIEVEQILTLPTDYPATQSLLYTVRALSRGDPRIDNLVTWVFTDVSIQGADLTLIGYRVLPWPFEPNLAEPIRQAYGYLTDILCAKDGTEQRVQLRATPTGTIGFANLLEERDAQHANAILHGSQAHAFGVPLWGYREPLLAAIDLWATDVEVATLHIPHHDGGLIIIWRNPYEWEVATIESVVVNRITVSSPLQSAWPAAGTWVVPIVVGRLSPSEAFRWETLRVGSTRLTFDIDSFVP